RRRPETSQRAPEKSGAAEQPRCTACLPGRKCCEVHGLRGYLLMAEEAPGPATRPSLLLRIRDPRDEQSWGLFRDVYGPLVWQHCRRRGLQYAEPAAVTQRGV